MVQGKERLQPMIGMLKKVFDSRRQHSKTNLAMSSENQELIASTDDMKISAETEVDFIKSLLEKKFGRRFQMRVRVNGYLGDDMKYFLVVDDYCNDDSQRKYHSVSGYETKNVLDVKSEFLRAYWNIIEKVHDSVGKQLDSWDARMIADYKDVMVVDSREELLMKARLEGVI